MTCTLAGATIMFTHQAPLFLRLQLAIVLADELCRPRHGPDMTRSAEVSLDTTPRSDMADFDFSVATELW